MRVLQGMRSSAPSFNFHYLLVSWRSSMSCLRLRHRLTNLSFFPSITRFRRQFLCKMWPIQLSFIRFTLYRIFFSPRHFVIGIFHLFTRSVQMNSIFFRLHILQLARHLWSTSAVSLFQHHTKLCSQCSTSLVSSLNSTPICWWQELPSHWILLLPWQSWTSFRAYILPMICKFRLRVKDKIKNNVVHEAAPV